MRAGPWWPFPNPVPRGGPGPSRGEREAPSGSRRQGRRSPLRRAAGHGAQGAHGVDQHQRPVGGDLREEFLQGVDHARGGLVVGEKESIGPGYFSRASLMCPLLKPPPRGASRAITFAPLLETISRKRSPKVPQEKEITLSPGASRLVQGPRAGTRQDGPGSSTSRSLPRRPFTSSSRSDHSSPRWLIIGPAAAILTERHIHRPRCVQVSRHGIPSSKKAGRALLPACIPQKPCPFSPVRPRVYSGSSLPAKGGLPLSRTTRKRSWKKRSRWPCRQKGTSVLKGNHSPVETMNDLYHEGAQR